MENQRRDDSPSGLSDIVEGDGLLGTGLTVGFFPPSDGAPPTKLQADWISSAVIADSSP